MERLRQQDAAGGAAAQTPLSEEQRAAIAAARRDYEAKVAQAEILLRSTLAVTVDPEARQQLETNHRRDLGQFVSSRDRKIAAARQGGAA